MGILIGTISTGTIHEYNSQAIKTKFVIIGIPLFPIGSFYKITDNMGIPIGLNGKSVWVGYSRTTLLALGILLSMFAWNLFKYDNFERIFFTIIGVLFIFNGVLNWALHWSLKSNEERVREILSQAFEYNMLPDYLSIELRASLYKELLKKYNLQYPETEWENEIANSNIDQTNATLLFSLSYYATLLTNEEKYKTLFIKIDNYLKERGK